MRSFLRFFASTALSSNSSPKPNAGMCDFTTNGVPQGQTFTLDYGRNPIRKVYVEAAIALIEASKED